MSSPYDTGRVLRQTRQPRVLYTPEVASPRARNQLPRHGAYSSPQLGSTLSTNGLNASSAQSGGNANGPIAILVMTPANRPGKPFQSPFYEPSNNVGSYGRGLTSHVIGQGARGVDWVTRISMALKSGIQSEADWALVGLMDLSCRQPEMLDLSTGDILLQTLIKLISSASFWSSDLTEEDEFLEKDDEFDIRQKVLISLLIIRNLALDPKNAQIMALNSQLLTFIENGLALPHGVSRFTELRSYIIDIAESISFHLNVESKENQFFEGVISTLSVDSQDRGILIPALRTLSRLVVRDENNLLGEDGLPKALVTNILRYLTVDDDELISASLDLLYQYTLRRDNIDELLGSLYNQEICSTHLVRLLSWKLHEPEADYYRLPRKTLPSPPVLPEWIVNELLEFEEPDRATNWIRASYVNDPTGEVTQISLWKAYETRFESYSRQGRKLLPAVEFIKNVTSAFDDCQAMVVNLPDGSRKFIIKGIKPREFPVAPSALNSGGTAEPPKKKLKGLLAKDESAPNGPGFGVTATLVLQNLAQTASGKQLLLPKIPQMIEASVLNPAISSHLDALLSELDRKVSNDKAEEKA